MIAARPERQKENNPSSVSHRSERRPSLHSQAPRLVESLGRARLPRIRLSRETATISEAEKP